MRHCRHLLCWLILAAALARVSCAWWSEGHEVIDRAACEALPADMPEFFLKGADTIASYSAEPDLWTSRELPALRSSERPNHYIDLELLGDRELPRTRDEFPALCRKVGLSPSEVGTLPYAVEEWYERLVMALAEHRKWPDDRAVQAKALYLAGVLSHYTGDVSQPLHCTVHYDGRAEPDGSSPRTGIHLKMDALPGQLVLDHEELAEGLKAQSVEDVFAATVTAIRDSNSRVERLYELEGSLPSVEEAPGAETDARVRALAVDCCKAGAELTASLWYSAWLESAEIPVPEWHRRIQEVRKTEHRQGGNPDSREDRICMWRE